ncbi:unnamed protein product [Cylindrotheca closterium]|uniref:Uncharacterized protein n=1 Tax=Cylindrotheca closterium TaxID=2856 RepID=A0AAD2FGQ4_9STRA|nr:unnamed protein product [Cylindrotheca closterium]
MKILKTLSLLFLFSSQAASFTPSRNSASKVSATDHAGTVDASETSRRSFFESMALIPLVAMSVESANASGGATAGGAYLLSAKQRYNERVKTAVKGLLEVGTALKGGSTKEAEAYFGSEDAGSWKDLTAAGYLLSNAFRRSSTTSPDSLPAVKKYKALVKEVEGLQKKLKKGAGKAADQFSTVEEALEIWLTEIELPPAKEL